MCVFIPCPCRRMNKNMRERKRDIRFDFQSRRNESVGVEERKGTHPYHFALLRAGEYAHESTFPSPKDLDHRVRLQSTCEVTSHHLHLHHSSNEKKRNTTTTQQGCNGNTQGHGEREWERTTMSRTRRSGCLYFTNARIRCPSIESGEI